MTALRQAVVNWATWAVANKGWFTYQESRPFPLYEPSASRHIANDCSATVVLCFWLASAPDPTGNHFNGYGNTDSLVAHCQQIPLSVVQPGDLVIYYEGGQTVHTAIIVQADPDPLTMSHGMPSEPALVHVSQDGRPHLYFRALPVDPPAPPIPPVQEDDDMQPFIAHSPTRQVIVSQGANGLVAQPVDTAADGSSFVGTASGQLGWKYVPLSEAELTTFLSTVA